MAELFRYLAQRYPETLTDIIARSLSAAGESDAYAAMPGECWDVIHLLPTESKLEIRALFRDSPVRNWLLASSMASADPEWLEALLASNDISPDEALSFYNGIAAEIPIEKLAKILVPRGVDPQRIAALRQHGNFSGNFSSWYQSIVDYFEAMSDTTDPDVKAVAESGVRLFTVMHEDAANKERVARIRGRLG